MTNASAYGRILTNAPLKIALKLKVRGGKAHKSQLINPNISRMK